LAWALVRKSQDALNSLLNEQAKTEKKIKLCDESISQGEKNRDEAKIGMFDTCGTVLFARG
jgi:hypothetical protein